MTPPTVPEAGPQPVEGSRDTRECPNRASHKDEACATCGLIMDYPTAFAFADTVPLEGHHERCSKRAGMLCDCDVVNKEYERRKSNARCRVR